MEWLLLLGIGTVVGLIARYFTNFGIDLEKKEKPSLYIKDIWISLIFFSWGTYIIMFFLWLEALVKFFKYIGKKRISLEQILPSMQQLCIFGIYQQIQVPGTP